MSYISLMVGIPALIYKEAMVYRPSNTFSPSGLMQQTYLRYPPPTRKLQLTRWPFDTCVMPIGVCDVCRSLVQLGFLVRRFRTRLCKPEGRPMIAAHEVGSHPLPARKPASSLVNGMCSRTLVRCIRVSKWCLLRISYLRFLLISIATSILTFLASLATSHVKGALLPHCFDFLKRPYRIYASNLEVQ